MKKLLKKSIVIILIAMLLSYPTAVIATNEQTESEVVMQLEQNDIIFKDTIKRSNYNKLLAGNSSVDSSYNLAENCNIKVKDQKKVGSCWAFAFTSMLETTIKNNEEYSPMHIEYKTGEMYNRELGAGGNFLDAISYSVSGYGPVLEEDFPFESVYDETKNSEENYYLADMDSVSLDNIDAEAVIKDATYFSAIYKDYEDDGTITYTDSNPNVISFSSKYTYTEDEVKAIRNLIKSHIKNNGAVIASFYSDLGKTVDGETVSLGGYYNPETNAFYCDASGSYLGSVNANHAVTIVGWDDNYKKENFAEGKQPAHDGAYIVLNSYGTEFGDNGYFYVSYDDCCIEQQVLGANSVEEIDKNSETAKYKYQYDELGINYSLAFTSGYLGMTPVETLYAANVFNKKDTNHIESLTEIGLFLAKTQGIEIYVNPSSDDINNCTLVGTYTGDNALEAGYHTVQLSSPVNLTGDKFVIKIKFINSEGAAIPVECNFKNSGYTAEVAGEELLNRYIKATSNQGESYFSTDGEEWDDLYGYVADDTITFKDTNVCIKAFTVQGDEMIAATGVKLDKTTLTMQVGDEANLVATVTPTNALNKNVTWTSSDESVATISESGIITAKAKGTTTITVKTEDGGYTATCKLTVNEKTNYADDIYKDDENNKTDVDNTKIDTDNTNSGNSSKNDGSVANKVLPQTGSKLFILVVGVAIIVTFIIRKKYQKYNVR